MPRARSTDPTTSHEAADSLTDVRASQLAVWATLFACGPTTDGALVDFYTALAERGGIIPRQSPSGIRTRRKELVESGDVRDTGRKVRLTSGRRAIVWEAVQS